MLSVPGLCDDLASRWLAGWYVFAIGQSGGLCHVPLSANLDQWRRYYEADPTLA